MKNSTLFIWIFSLCGSLLLVKGGLTWDKELPGKPNITFGQKMRQQGKIFERPMVEVNYNKRQFPTYSPLINRKPRRWGTFKQ